MLRRLQVDIVTVTHKTIIAMLLICDALTVITMVILLPVRPLAKESCVGLY